MKSVVFLGIMALLFSLGCSSTVTVEQENTPPQINFAPTPLAVPKGLDVVLSVNASDEDDDALYITWEKSRGIFNQQQQGEPDMTWTAPDTTGTDTIIATASDGQASRSDTLIIEVGTRWTQDINGQETWRLHNSPYIVVPPGDRLSIFANTTLTIDSGVKVYIDVQDMTIDVVGMLKINGEANNPVVIKPNVRSPQPGFWIGVQATFFMGQAGSLDITYADISFAEYNIRADQLANVTLEGCHLSRSLREGVYFRSSGTLMVNNCEVSDNRGNGIKVELISGVPSSVAITNSNIRYNQGSGVIIDLRDFTGTAPIDISGDSITVNSFHGIQLINGAYPVIRNNAIFLNDITRVNGGNNIHLEPGFSGTLPSIDARCNYWGDAYLPQDSTLIKQFILDGWDRVDISARVRIAPWVNTYPEACSP